MNVLIIDDSRSARHHVRMILESLKVRAISEAASLAEAREALARQPIDLSLVDICLSEDARNRDGLTLVKEVSEGTSAAAVCITASGEMATIRTAMRSGAYDYILKEDLCEEILAPIIEGLRSRRLLEREVSQLRARFSADAPLSGLVGTSAAMDRLRDILRRVALSDRPALLTGPTGSGKEVVVRMLHALGPNPEAPLEALNCSGFVQTLIESELFGHERNAFTGATEKKLGHFATVGRGTLFLDEIAELPMEQQAKLLRVLEDGRFRSVGGAEQRFEGRVVAATHANLQDRVREGRFREDLYYRLNVLQVRVPALDEHREDIPALIAHFVKRQRRPLLFTREAVELLQQRDWPGNVRQLRSLVDYLAVMSDSDTVTPEVIAQMTDTARVSAQDQLREAARRVLVLPITGDRLEATKNALIDEAMAQSGGNKTAAGRLLGVNRKVVERSLGNGNGDSNGDDSGG